jgi:hypothetical protein
MPSLCLRSVDERSCHPDKQTHAGHKDPPLGPLVVTKNAATLGRRVGEAFDFIY